MAKAIRCDRCGKYFDAPLAEKYKKVVLCTGIDACPVRSRLSFELCNECFEQIKSEIVEPEILP